MSTAVYILNRMPIVVLQGLSPFGKLYGQPPLPNHIRVFGSLCYATNQRHLDDFAPRVVPAVHMGYSSSKKGYIFYDLSLKTFFISKDTVFKEDVVPFRDLKSSPYASFPDLTMADDSVRESSSIALDVPTTTFDPHEQSQVSECVPDTALRKYTKVTKPHVSLDNYITPSAKYACLYPISHNVS